MRKEYDDRKNDTTASRVRVLREKNGLTQQELADKIGITNSQISRLESGKTKNISSFMKIIRDLKESMAEEQPCGAVATAEAVKKIYAAYQMYKH